MTAAAADRHLLFGLLALQNGLIDQVQLIAAFQAWTRDKARSLADQLVARGDLDADARAGLEAIVALHFKKHGDVEHSLAAVPANRSTRASLAELGEPEIEATLARIARPKNGHATEADDDHDPDRTGTLAVGGSTGDGQRFRLLRPHARGGLGEVFVALDSELHREVALKQILEKHADDPVSRQRFVAEAEITGGLEHPGIVPVYGVGATAGGRPYYAMRFIRGDSLKEAIEHFHGDDTLKHNPGRRSLELRKLLRRFLDVCNAVGYAHSRGVIHRDLKPANIILGRHGETLVVDWGLAKAIGRADPSIGEQTIAPSSSGSSETLPGSALGTPAYMSPEQASGDLDRLGPRSDAYSLGATLYCLLTGKPPFEGDDIGAILRRVQAGDFRSPREVDPALDRPLEAICTKAMATRPEDRYATCRALAEDVERWAADEPVTAYPEPWTRTLIRWLTRHRTGVTGVAAAVLAGVVGLAAVLAVQTRANLALADKNTALLAANAKIEARYNLAALAIKTFHTGVSEDFLLKEEKFKALRDRLLKSAADFYGKLGALLDKDTDIVSRRALAQSNFELEELTGKVRRNEDALAVHRAVLAAREALAAENPADVEIKSDVGNSLKAVAGLHHATGKTKEAEAEFRKALAIYQKLADDNSAVPEYQSGLASIHLGLAKLLLDMGKPSEAEAENRKALAIYQKLADDNPGVPEYQSGLGSIHLGLGVFLYAMGKPSEAEAEFRKSLAIYQKLADDNPAVLEYRVSLSWAHHDLALTLGRGRRSEVDVELRKALEILQKVADENPAVTKFQSSLAHAYAAMGEGGKARAIYQKLVDDNFSVVEFRRGLAHEYYLHEAPLQAWLGQDKEFSSTCEKLLSLAKDTEDSMLADTAAKCCSLRPADPERHEAALVLARRAVEHGKGSPWLNFCLMALGMAEYRSGHFAEADAALTAAVNAPNKNINVSSTSAFYRAMSLFRQGKTDLAKKLATEAAAQMKPLPVDERHPLADGAGTNDLVMWLAYKEAKAMIQFDATPALHKGATPANAGTPAEAEAELRNALALDQSDLAGDYLKDAVLHAWFGQDNELSSTCEKLLSLAKDTEDPELADKAAKSCSLRQADPKQCVGALVLARRAVEHGKGSQWLAYFEMALGMAEYRSGHFAEADAALIAAATRAKDDPRVVGTSAFYRAMGLFRQGKTDLARKLATEAAAKMKPLPVDEKKPLKGGGDEDDLILWLAYKEAKAMIPFDATRAAPPQPHTK